MVDLSQVLPVFQSKEEIRAYYNKVAKVYDVLAERSEQPMREAGLHKLDPQPGERILEIGFGTGHCLVVLARAVGPTGKVYGIDIAENMLAEARKLLDRKGLSDRVELCRGDAASLPYTAGSMDGIFASFTLELFDTPEIPQVLAEWKRVLRPHGRIGVVSLSKTARDSMAVRIYEWTHRHFPNLLNCRPIFVRQSLESAGFGIEDAALEQMWVPVEIVLARNEDESE